MARNKDIIKSDQLIVLYDGYCNLCVGFVKRMLKNSKSDCIVYQSIQVYQQSATALVKLPEHLDPQTLIVVKGDVLYRGAQAVILIMKRSGFVLRLFGKIASLLPLRFLDWLYAFVASNRYKWFGRRAVCYYDPNLY